MGTAGANAGSPFITASLPLPAAVVHAAESSKRTC